MLKQSSTTRFTRLVAVLFGIVLILGLGTSLYAAYKARLYQKEEVPPAVDFNQLQQADQAQNPVNTKDSQANLVQPDTSKPATSSSPSTKPISLPPKDLNLKMTFYSQAPFGDWSMPWQEACEEASELLIANVYFNHNWTREQFRDGILQLIDWEQQHLGHNENTTVADMVQVLDQYFGLKTVIHENPTFDDLKNALAKGNLVIMPFAGKVLANPYFTNGGPVYHVLVVKGYESTPAKIITEDVGTRHGEDFVYTWDHANLAMHDFADPIENGPKRFIEVIRPQPTTTETPTQLNKYQK